MGSKTLRYNTGGKESLEPYTRYLWKQQLPVTVAAPASHFGKPDHTLQILLVKARNKAFISRVHLCLWFAKEDRACTEELMYLRMKSP